MGYSHAVRQSVLKKVLPPEGRSISEVSRETGVNDQTIRNWIKRSKTGILADGNQDSCPRFLTPKEKYQLVIEVAGIDDEQLWRMGRSQLRKLIAWETQLASAMMHSSL